MRRDISIVWLCLSGAACLSNPSFSLAAPPEHADEPDAIQSIIDVGESQKSPGCAVGVLRNGDTMAERVSGVADTVSRRPLSPDTLFYGASLSKQFTALLIVMLAQQGKLTLDDDVRKWIPELPVYEGPVTLRMLLHHTAGIRDSLDLLRLSGVQNYGDVSRASALRLLYRQSSTNFRPGTEFKYSNAGYLLLSEVVARVSGVPFADFSRQMIFAPLGMTRSFFLADAPPNVPDVAHGYMKTESGFERRDTYPLMSGSGGLMTSVNDLVLFERDAEVGHRVWTEPITRTLMEPGKLTNGETVIEDSNGLVYGAGLTVGMRKGRFWVEHAGGAEGFHNLYARIPERHEAVIMLCNRVDLDLQAKVDALFEAIDPGIFPKTSDSGSPSGAHPPISTDASAAAVVPPGVAKLAGSYYSKDLDASYIVSVSPIGKMTIRVSSPWAGAANTIKPPQYVFLGDGSWGEVNSPDGSHLIFDVTGNGFTLSTDRAHGIQFVRSLTSPRSRVH